MNKVCNWCGILVSKHTPRGLANYNSKIRNQNSNPRSGGGGIG